MSATKWILGALGFVMGGPIGAIVGVVMGALFDGITGMSVYSSPNESSDAGGRSFSGASRHVTGGDIRITILVLIACVMKADGKVLKSEVTFIKPYLLRWYGEEGAKQALQVLKQLLERDMDYATIAAQVKDNINYSNRLEIVNILLQLAYADGEIDSSELRMIERIAAGMGVTPTDVQSMTALYMKGRDADWAYKALEIASDATDDEVKKAYRRMAMKYHPDKVTDAAQEVKDNATEKFRAIHEAYEHIKTVRGIK